MSDLRDFNPSNDFRADSIVHPSPEIIHPRMDDEPIIHTLDDSGGLQGFHKSDADWEEPGSGKTKIIGALIVALMVGTAGAYAYSNWSSTPKPVVADNSLPQTTQPK